MSKGKKKKLKGNMWDGMTTKQFRGIELFIGRLLSTLMLSEWQIKVDHIPVEEDEGDGNGTLVAFIDPCFGRKVATLHMAHDFLEMPRDEIAQTLIHELVHLHHRDMLEPVRLMGESGALGSQAYQVLMDSIKSPMEVMVDQIARAFERLIDYEEDMDAIKPKDEES